MQRLTPCCLDAETGRVLWDRELPKSSGDRQYGHAGIRAGLARLGHPQRRRRCRAEQSHRRSAWSHPGFPGLATPVLFTWKTNRASRFSAATNSPPATRAVDASFSKSRGSTDLAVNACDPIIIGEKIFLCSDYGFGRRSSTSAAASRSNCGNTATAAATPSVPACSTTARFTASPPIICLPRSRDGQPLWREQGGGSVLLIGDKCVRVRSRGDLIIGRVSPEGFAELQTEVST
jgi:hypothetical protein